MFVHSTLVVDEVLVYGEGRLCWSVGHEFLHDVLLFVHHVMGLLTESLIRVVLGGGASFAARLSGSINMVLTWLNIVGLATNVRSIFATRHNTLSLPVLPGIIRETSVTSKSTAVAAA